MTKLYEVDFNTGAGNETFDSLEEAKVYAEENVAYTSEKVTIRENGLEVAYLPWYDVAPSEDDEVTAAFGSFGFYGEWVNL